jgi:hypothetical protein
MAQINAPSTTGSIFSNFIASAISMVVTGLQIKKFDDEAKAWLLA